MMTFGEYQKKSRETAIYPHQGSNIIYPLLGLCGETGEVAEKIKKVIRDQQNIINGKTRLLLKKELGDILWYLAQLATELRCSLDDIAITNIEKLQSRKDRGVLGGSGDQR